MSENENVINSIIELLKECTDIELLYLIESLLVTDQT